jgi:hypothetical protein
MRPRVHGTLCLAGLWGSGVGSVTHNDGIGLLKDYFFGEGASHPSPPGAKKGVNQGRCSIREDETFRIFCHDGLGAAGQQEEFMNRLLDVLYL